MENEILIALLSKMVDERLARLPVVPGGRGPRGHMGLPGRDGQGFIFADHEEAIRQWAKEFALKFEDFTAEQIEAVRGPRGQDGRDGADFSYEESRADIESAIIKAVSDSSEALKLRFADLSADDISKLRGPAGRDGRDGVDFSFEENRASIVEVIQSFSSDLKLKFADLAAEEIAQLRGPRGRDGKDGIDGTSFCFESDRLRITEIINATVTGMSDSLKLRFSDLGSDDIDKLRGPRGRDGRDGRDFVFDEHISFFEGLRPRFQDFTSEERESLRLHFSDLTPEEKSSLKIRFEDFTEEEISLIRGPRGAKGQKGSPGREGQAGPMGPRGVPGQTGVRGFSGINGRDGRNGEDGRDGLDAPRVVDVKVEQVRDEVGFEFLFSDGSAIHTDRVKLPNPVNVYQSGGFAGRRIRERAADLTNGQAVAANVSGMIAPTGKSHTVQYYIERVTTGVGATEMYATGQAFVTKVGSSYRWTPIAEDEVTGVDFTIDASGQVQYTSTTFTGTPSSSYITWTFTSMTGAAP